MVASFDIHSYRSALHPFPLSLIIIVPIPSTPYHYLFLACAFCLIHFSSSCHLILSRARHQTGNTDDRSASRRYHPRTSDKTRKSKRSSPITPLLAINDCSTKILLYRSTVSSFLAHQTQRSRSSTIPTTHGTSLLICLSLCSPLSSLLRDRDPLVIAYVFT